ncbi:hypothetical protein DPMN_166189 [Dreissena polymorpha]|uniref:Uncharacterized protein n=1 Tax=Dreissena polymorpha TaxID=45954 RepID=A0A9D4IX60_DREPO|nr:hypothetical protein DPMN_166189 [Dreissena polymorpha]
MSDNGKSEQPKLNFKGQKSQTQPANKNQRADSSNSTNTSMDELFNSNTQLKAMTEGLRELRKELMSMLKREEIEDLIQKTISAIMSKIEETMSKKSKPKLIKELKHNMKN